MVGESDTDRAATDDMFAVLQLALSARLNRRLSTAIDSTALEQARRLAYLVAARRNNMTTVAVVFRTSAATCLEQNRARQRQVPDEIIRAHVEQTAALRPSDLLAEGFDQVLDIC
jgi:predicted kinase